MCKCNQTDKHPHKENHIKRQQESEKESKKKKDGAGNLFSTEKIYSPKFYDIYCVGKRLANWTHPDSNGIHNIVIKDGVSVGFRESCGFRKEVGWKGEE